MIKMNLSYNFKIALVALFGALISICSLDAFANKPSTPTSQAKEDTVDKTGWKPIDINLPSAMFVGTPQDIEVKNLEKPLGKPRPPFLAPPDTMLLSLKKPITSSDDDPIIGRLKYITDGDKEAADGSFVELMPLKQHVTIDLGKEYEIWAIVVWHYHLQPRVYFDVIAQIGTEPDFLMDVKTIFNNDNDNSYGLVVGKDLNYIETNEGKLIDAKKVKGRYVRLHSNKNSNDDLNHYIEISVYGREIK